ncbi:MAG: hypothetical protein ACP5HZ_00655 [Ferrimicrobium sp.]|uniref:hypothetical protein n=1 Tax=Ferrimicrobium sp. TaxID=2926050 RepID=UPI0027E3D629|nr:hypothetical protein [Ferrimicrobium sp.]
MTARYLLVGPLVLLDPLLDGQTSLTSPCQLIDAAAVVHHPHPQQTRTANPAVVVGPTIS